MQRAVCQAMLNEFNASQGIDADLKAIRTISDFDNALRQRSGNAYALYNRANIHAMRKDYDKAIEDYDKAIALEPKMAEAYYNRGLCRIYKGEKSKGTDDLSKAGELGLFKAYSVIKKYR